MSVPAWKRDISKTEYIKQLMDLNITIGKIVTNKPKKYKQNYGDKLIKLGLDALSHCIEANSIFIGSKTLKKDYLIRRELLLQARGEVKAISTISYIFLELCKNEDSIKLEKIRKDEQRIGSATEDIKKLISGVLKSDTQRIKKQTN